MRDYFLFLSDIINAISMPNETISILGTVFGTVVGGNLMIEIDKTQYKKLSNAQKNIKPAPYPS
ncbi:exonuclease 3'-5' domain-containing protein 2 isoform X2 [Oceanobacillus picturae]|jgi:hypothetical protein|uniref:Exonuclease 3'-5' domain-containing protein 2 isoform X2 n=1 Tax=Oceanobacillus picturae TaxID=171693 RepID=A0A0U9HDB2_9BACI|nr:exonuclease 3'-5' domain-containing protein 2 isoform X2 [Oceanobacillus picturae]